ncbi:hypothetical protein NK118_14820, partial [Lachnospiraceae bacterium PAL227]
ERTTIELPKDRLKKGEKGNYYTAILNREELLDVRVHGYPVEAYGKDMEEYFNASELMEEIALDKKERSSYERTRSSK